MIHMYEHTHAHTNIDLVKNYFGFADVIWAAMLTLDSYSYVGMYESNEQQLFAMEINGHLALVC